MAAFNSFIRRASASRQSICRQFLSVSRLSTAADNNLLGLIESDFSAQLSAKYTKPTVSDEFPFEIEHTAWGLTLQRIYQKERIFVSADLSDEERLGDPPLVVQVLRENDELEFDIIVKDDQIRIRDATFSVDEGGHLDVFDDYLKIRGITPDLMKHLLNYTPKLL